MRKISLENLNYLKQWEGLKLESYQDIRGVWTIGYGHTGSEVCAGQIITEKEAEGLLLKDLVCFEQAVSRLVHVPLTDNQFTTLVSFVFNVGIKSFEKSRMLQKLNKGHYDAVPIELLRWVYHKGKKAPGLINRRAAEIGLWAKGSFVESQILECQHEDSKKLSHTKEGKAIVLTGLGAVGASCYELAQNIYPFISTFLLFRYIFIFLLLMGIGVTFFSIFERVRK